ncbi:MAG: helicase-related protein [Thermoleophilaceae bacterium]
MNGRPDLLDNLRAGASHADGLAYLTHDIPDEHELSVAVGYVNLGGLHRLAAAVGEARQVRLMLGAEPDPGLGAPLPLNRFELQVAALRGERDFSRFPPSRAAKRLVEVQSWLTSSEVEVRRYVTRFLHGKAYLFGSMEDPRAALVSSANLTGGGLVDNLELGLVDYNVGPSRAAIEWFDGLWDFAEDFKEPLLDLLFPAAGLVDPETVYLRALLELYGEELEQGQAGEVAVVRLARFQRDGYERARRILELHRGVLYADGVGTGKTAVGLAFIEEYALEQGRLAVVVCPAQLKEMWEKQIRRARLPAEVLSFQELASDEQLVPDGPVPRRNLAADRDAYRLVLVDEAHALRNEDTVWYRAMERLLGGERKDAVLLSATPVNNGLWDLYNLVMLFARHDRAFASAGIPSLRKLFVAAGANERDPESLDPDVLFPVADAVSVRRDRRFILEHYAGETFPDGTEVRFPNPVVRTERYDLDGAHPGLFGEIVASIEALEMARYRPSSYLLEPEDDRAEGQLGALLQSAILKRFESCWAACLATVERMIVAHDAFLAAWDDGSGMVPSKAVLAQAAKAESDAAGIAAWVADALEEDPGSRPASDYAEEYGPAVGSDRARLVRIRDRLAGLSPEDDPKLALLARLLEGSKARKIAIFATYGETVRYLHEHLPGTIGGRERVAVVGSETTPDARTGMLGRFSPHTVVAAEYVPPEGEVDLLISTDVLSEGQNLQQAEAVISYDMPWNPQRVVQRNGRVVRLLSPHDEVFLTTMLPVEGELEELLRLESIVRAKIRAAGVFGMETEVIEGVVHEELRAYADRLVAGEVDLTDEGETEEASGAFIGEELRAMLLRALEEGELRRIRELPWGIGAVVRRTSGQIGAAGPGVFFACRTRPMAGAADGYRYWRHVELEPAAGSDGIVRSDLTVLRTIDPGGVETAELGLDIEDAWRRAAADIVETHNRRADPRQVQESIGPAQRFALELLRDPSVVLPEGAELAEAALSVERGTAARRALNEIRAELAEERIDRNEAAVRVVELVDRTGLRPVALDDLPEEIDAEDLGVVCWMAVVD